MLRKRAYAHAAVVFIHGSGPQTRDLHWAKRFASEGIAALVYDKRGVGNSGGEYEQNQNVSEKNISLLADDAVAALKRLSAHGALKSTPLGFAASAKPGGSRRWQRREPSLRRSSCSEADRSTRSSEEDIYSKYTADADKDSVPSFEEALRSRKQKYVWPDFLGRDTDSSEDLERLSIPGLWIFSDNDASIPVDISIEGLNALRRKGHRYDYVLFSGLGHNNMDRTFHVATDWIERTS